MNYFPLFCKYYFEYGFYILINILYLLIVILKCNYSLDRFLILILWTIYKLKNP